MGNFSQGIGAGLSIGRTIRENMDRDERLLEKEEDKKTAKGMADLILNYDKEQSTQTQAPAPTDIGMQGDMEKPTINAIPDGPSDDLPAADQSTTGMKPVSEQQYAKDNAEGELPPPNKIIQKTMLTGSHMKDPRFLDSMGKYLAQRAKETGNPAYLEKWKVFADMSYSAQKTGVTDSIRHFAMNDPVKAAAALRRGGYQVDGTPEPVKGKKDTWMMKVNGEEQEVDIGQLISAADPEKFIDEYYKAKGSTKDTALAGKYKEQTKTEKAKQAKLNALTKKYEKQTKNIGVGDGKGESNSEYKNLPNDVKTSKWLASAPEKDVKAFNKLMKEKGEVTKAKILELRTKMMSSMVENGASPEEAKEEVDKILRLAQEEPSKEKPVTEDKEKTKRRRYNPVTNKFE